MRRGRRDARFTVKTEEGTSLPAQDDEFNHQGEILSERKPRTGKRALVTGGAQRIGREIALTLARARGVGGPRLAAYAAEVGPVDVAAVAAPYVTLGAHHGMPAPVARGVLPQLVDAAAAAAKRLGVR